jgi:hypothetical protein
MYLNYAKTAFGRHESFALRFGWLTKGFQAFERRKEIFTDENSVVELGVGRNMVNSIRHWLRAAQLIEIKIDVKRTTSLGQAIFSKDGWDPYLEDEATIWLIHWLIATNPEHATAWYWFFNLYHKPEFTGQEVTKAINDFAKEKIDGKFSANTVKQDISVLLRSYVETRGNKKTTAEEALDSPLSLLRLITYSQSTKIYQSRLDSRESLPIGVFGYTICEYFKELDKPTIPIENLMYQGGDLIAPGLVFRMTESALLSKLEQLVDYIPGVFELRDTAGIHQLYQIKPINPISFLDKHYTELN